MANTPTVRRRLASRPPHSHTNTPRRTTYLACSGAGPSWPAAAARGWRCLRPWSWCWRGTGARGGEGRRGRWMVKTLVVYESNCLGHAWLLGAIQPASAAARGPQLHRVGRAARAGVPQTMIFTVRALDCKPSSYDETLTRRARHHHVSSPHLTRRRRPALLPPSSHSLPGARWAPSTPPPRPPAPMTDSMRLRHPYSLLCWPLES